MAGKVIIFSSCSGFGGVKFFVVPDSDSASLHPGHRILYDKALSDHDCLCACTRQSFLQGLALFRSLKIVNRFHHIDDVHGFLYDINNVFKALVRHRCLV